MATFSRPGVFVQEAPLPQSVTLADNGTAIGALVGALPQGPASPTLVNSWLEFVKTFGSYKNDFPTTFAAYAFFANGGRNLFVNRVLGADAEAATVTLTDTDEVNTLRVDAINAGSWGNDITVEVKEGNNNRFTLLIYGAPVRAAAAANSNLLEQFNDLTMDAEDPRYVVAVVNALSAYIRVTDLASATTFPGNTPLAAGLKILTSGDNGSAPSRTNYQDALEQFDTIQTPLVINLPDVAYLYEAGSVSASTQLTNTKNILSDLMEYCELRGDAFAIVDTPKNMTATEALSFVDALYSQASAGADGSNAAVYFPWLVVSDPIRSTPGATRILPPGAAVIGQYLATDAARGVFKAPAGLGNRVNLAVATERSLTNAELDALNSANVPVNAIRSVPGAGIVVMGARTMHNNPGDRYVNVRRSLIFIKKQITDMTSFAVFENNDERLWAQIRSSLTNFLASYWSQGGLRGADTEQAFYVRCDETNNSTADILNGRVNIEVGVAVQYPAEFVVITIGQMTGNASA